MDYSKLAFIRMAIDDGALRFGRFTLKSGRISPYFFNAALFYSGNSLKILGEYYANTLLQNKIQFQHLFGPAYKGFAIATATAIALSNHQINCTVTFNRKEHKDHGEGGMLIGAPLTNGDTILIDDVISAGTAFRESQKFIIQHGGTLTGVLIALDRCERGISQKSTIDEIKDQKIAVFSIITVYDLLAYLYQENDIHSVKQIETYLDDQGA